MQYICMRHNQYTYTPPSEEELEAIRRYYEQGHTLRDVTKTFKISFCKLYSLRDKGLLTLTRDEDTQKEICASKHRGLKHTQSTKDKLAQLRKEWIKNNPDRHPWKFAHKSIGESYPEKYFREWLEKEGLPFVQEYSYKTYHFDFLVGNAVDLEIDGSQHKSCPAIIEHDLKRNKIVEAAGFIVKRISWPDYARLSAEDRGKYLRELKEFLLGNQRKEAVIEDVTVPVKLKKEDPRKRQALSMLKSGASYKAVGREFGVSDNSVRKWIISLGENPKDYGRKTRKNF